MVAVVPMFDPPRIDTKETIERCIEKGIMVKMVTGDQLLIGKETAKQLGMGQKFYTTEELMAVRARPGAGRNLLGFNKGLTIQFYTTEELMAVRATRRAGQGARGLPEPCCKGSAFQGRPRAIHLWCDGVGCYVRLHRPCVNAGARGARRRA
jgi:hypothetical protein